MIVGTVPYMAPEQLRGEEADARTDVFALGDGALRNVHRARAFSGNDQATLISSILTSEPPPITDVRPISPAGLDLARADVLGEGPRGPLAIGA